jgi:hypothetical protein
MGARWWLQDEDTTTRADSFLPKVSSPLANSSSSTSCEYSNSSKPGSVPKGRSFKLEGWVIQPWKGLLTRSRPKIVVEPTGNSCRPS